LELVAHSEHDWGVDTVVVTMAWRSGDQGSRSWSVVDGYYAGIEGVIPDSISCRIKNGASHRMYVDTSPLGGNCRETCASVAIVRLITWKVNLGNSSSCANPVQNPQVVEKLVDLVGIEPTTSSMPWKLRTCRPLILKELMTGGMV
jgi:hypothetical protein